jgi:tryptophan-rich sensory protein
MRIPVESATTYRGRNSRANLPAMIISILLTLAVEVEGYLFSPASVPAAARWYARLAKPEWLPPQTWFAPIWSAIYALQGVALWLVWRERYHRHRNGAVAVFALQLALNAAWAPVFFGQQNIGIGFFISVALWLAVGWTMRAFARVKLLAAFVLLPYLLWAGVAVAMNYALWKLNP